MKYLNGDLIQLAKQGMFDVIGHGCNCFHTMGRGIAKSMKEAFPEIDMADKCSRYGDEKKLGTFTYVDYGNVVVLNLYTQYRYGSEKDYIDYGAIRDSMKNIKKRYSGRKIGLPMIGSGLAGGDWSRISEIIEEELDNEDVTIVKYKKK
jgi:O-acetyl-ADP-ribose deacetylase (regulator of RNase III)